MSSNQPSISMNISERHTSSRRQFNKIIHRSDCRFAVMLVYLIMLVLINVRFVLSIHNKRDKFLVVMEDDILLKFAVIVERQDM